MKKAIALAIVLLLALALLPGCDVLATMTITTTPLSTQTPSSTPILTPTPIATPSPTPIFATPPSLDASALPADGEAIVFKDPIVEKNIRQALSKPTGSITAQDMLKVTYFEFCDKDVKAFGGEIKSLEDLRWCLNLQRIILWETHITDISALSGTRDMVEFQCQDKLKDFTPLLSNENLNIIDLAGATDGFLRELMVRCQQLNKVYLYQSDISPETLRMLAEKDKITTLALINCGIKDISPVAGMKGLSYLSFEFNEIADISPLAGNTNLSSYLDLSSNKITDWSPLDDMESLRTLAVHGNPVTESPTLDKLARNGCTIYQ